MQQVKQLIKDSLAFFGINIELAREDPFKKFLRFRIQNAANPVLFDIGANDGAFAQNFITIEKIQVISFEPIVSCNEQLVLKSKDCKNWTIAPPLLALSDSFSEVDFYVSENIVSSSLLKITDKHIEAAPKSTVSNTLKVKTSTLDYFSKELNLAGKSIFIKIDVQGHELNVLKGAIKTLDAAILVAIEVSFEKLYTQSATFDEIYNFMCERGFFLCSAYEAFSDLNNGRCLQLDAVFEKL